MAVAMQWVNRVTTISLEMVIPAGFGYWLDQRYGTEPWLVSCGAVLGFSVGLWQLLQLAKVADSTESSRNQDQIEKP